MKGNISSKDGTQSVVDFPSLLPVRCVETCSGDVFSRRCSSQAWRLLPKMIRAAEIAPTTHPPDALNPNNINTKCYCTCKFQCYYRLGSFWSRIEHFWVVGCGGAGLGPPQACRPSCHRRLTWDLLDRPLSGCFPDINSFGFTRQISSSTERPYSGAATKLAWSPQSLAIEPKVGLLSVEVRY